jgi:hypothetical protein
MLALAAEIGRMMALQDMAAEQVAKDAAKRDTDARATPEFRRA